ncbi:MAG: hypothetical protein ACM34A_05150 [Bacillota bacterium]
MALSLIAIAPFLDHWYEGKIEEQLYEDKYNAQSKADEINAQIQRLNLDRNYFDLTKEERAEREELLQLQLVQLKNAEEAAKRIAKRTWQRNFSQPWWKYVPIAAAPVSLYAAFSDVFSSSFSIKAAIWSTAANACLFFGIVGYWRSRQWGGYAMGSFCLLFIGHVLFEMFSLITPSLLTSIVNLLVLIICLVPAAILFRSNGMKSSLVAG